MVIDAVCGGAVSHLGVGLSFGLAVMCSIFALGHISGAHINPAVTLGFAVTGRFPWAQVRRYLVGQLLGASAASAVHLGLFGRVADLGATIPTGARARRSGWRW